MTSTKTLSIFYQIIYHCDRFRTATVAQHVPLAGCLLRMYVRTDQSAATAKSERSHTGRAEPLIKAAEHPKCYSPKHLLDAMVKRMSRTSTATMTSTDAHKTNEDAASVRDEAIKFVCARHFHQCFWLPRNESRGRLRITYSTSSNFADTSLPVILVCLPMFVSSPGNHLSTSNDFDCLARFGSRWVSMDFDHLAASKGVRLLCIDRYVSSSESWHDYLLMLILQTRHGRLNSCATEDPSRSLARDSTCAAAQTQCQACVTSKPQRRNDLCSQHDLQAARNTRSKSTICGSHLLVEHSCSSGYSH